MLGDGERKCLGATDWASRAPQPAGPRLVRAGNKSRQDARRAGRSFGASEEKGFGQTGPNNRNFSSTVTLSC